MPAMLHVGLTGNIASGKSNAGRVFTELGAHVIDADAIAREVLAPGTDGYRRVVETFGSDILDIDQTINRRKLGDIVFCDSERRNLLNSLVHPSVRAEISRRIAELEQNLQTGIIIVDAALMVETGSYKMYDFLIVVTCDPALQLARIMNRDGLGVDEARARIAAQLPAEQKVKLADYTIDTSGTLRQTREQIEAIYRDLLLQEIRRTRLPGS